MPFCHIMFDLPVNIIISLVLSCPSIPSVLGVRIRLLSASVFELLLGLGLLLGFR
jgi:hypothetical protein